jgi:hypothetical protein
VHSPSLLGQICVEVSHELCELLGILRRDKQVEVIGQEREGMETQWVAFFCTSQNADDDARQSAGGLEQKAPLKRPAGHFYQTSFGNES